MGKLCKGGYSAAIAFLGALGASLTGSEGLGDLHAQQWVSMLLASLVAFGGTYGLAGWAGPVLSDAPKGGNAGGD